MNRIRFILSRAAVFAAVLTGLWALLFAAAQIPNERIYENMLQSSLSYRQAEAFEQPGSMRLVADNYADSILLNVTWNMGNGEPFTAALDTKYYDGEDYGENWGLFSTISGMAEANSDYTRYWHGMAALIRPMMLLTDVDGIKLAGMISALVLLAFNAAYLIIKKQYYAAGALTAAFLCVHIWDIRLSMEYQPAVLVTLVLLPLYIRLEEKGDRPLSALAVISGTMIAFFDFLTAETLTILIPLAVVFIMRKQSGRQCRFGECFRLTAVCGGCWAAAYAGTFLVKWAAASVVTGENKFLAAISSAEVRFIGGADDLSPVQQFFLAPLANISTLFGGGGRVDVPCIVGGLLISAAVLGAVFYLFRSGNADRGFNGIMAVIAGIPFVRFFLLNNHSYLHEYFTYRALAATILAVAAILWYSMELRPKGHKPKAEKKAKGTQ